ncbi:hypothetical protein [uncultured Clostridium sp.]|uniref:hypothetical protein n=1 Tax=uncultured Clostridium sp. TaxID=59620 RepID=UPI0025EC28FF|nr:hypothetical protein [uncultured Clostridium sp.]
MIRLSLGEVQGFFLKINITEEGQKKRLQILNRYYSDSEKVVERFLYDVPSRKKIDDVIQTCQGYDS